MNLQVVNCFMIVFSLFIEIGKGINSDSPRGCSVQKGILSQTIHIYGVSCFSGELGEIPSNFSENINFLEINSDSIENLTTNSLSRYTRLNYLWITHVGLRYVEETAFVQLKKLINLDLSGNVFTQMPLLPPSLEILTLNKMNGLLFESKQTFKRIAQVKSLKTLTLIQNGFEYLPTHIRELGTLKTLVLSSNKIKRLSVDDILPLCRLQELNVAKNNIDNRESAYCDCLFVTKWASEKAIKIHGLTCHVPQSGISEDGCAEKYHEHHASYAVEYYECRLVTQFFIIFEHWVYIVGGAIAVVILFVSFRCYLREELDIISNARAQRRYKPCSTGGSVASPGRIELEETL